MSIIFDTVFNNIKFDTILNMPLPAAVFWCKTAADAAIYYKISMSNKALSSIHSSKA